MDQGVASDGAAAGHIWAVHELRGPRSGAFLGSMWTSVRARLPRPWRLGRRKRQAAQLRQRSRRRRVDRRLARAPYPLNRERCGDVRQRVTGHQDQVRALPGRDTSSVGEAEQSCRFGCGSGQGLRRADAAPDQEFQLPVRPAPNTVPGVRGVGARQQSDPLIGQSPHVVLGLRVGRHFPVAPSRGRGQPACPRRPQAPQRAAGHLPTAAPPGSPRVFSMVARVGPTTIPASAMRPTRALSSSASAGLWATTSTPADTTWISACLAPCEISGRAACLPAIAHRAGSLGVGRFIQQEHARRLWGDKAPG